MTETKTCTNCGTEAEGKAEIKRLFGYRNMTFGVIDPKTVTIPQSWCRKCRNEKVRKKDLGGKTKMTRSLITEREAVSKLVQTPMPEKTTSDMAPGEKRLREELRKAQEMDSRMYFTRSEVNELYKATFPGDNQKRSVKDRMFRLKRRGVVNQDATWGEDEEWQKSQ